MADEEKSAKARGKKSQTGQNQASSGADKSGRKRRGAEAVAVVETAPVLA